MENVLTITNLKQNIIEFNAGLEGLNDNEMEVNLIIEANGVDFSFAAKRLQGTTWEVVIPPLPMLERTTYPFRMNVVSEGYFFNPINGLMNVVGTHEIYITDPQNRNIPPAKIDSAPIKHVAKPAGGNEVEDHKDKISPKVLKPLADTHAEKKKPVADIAEVAARLRALQTVEETEAPTTRKKSTKPKPKHIKKLDTNSANKITEKKVESKDLDAIADSIIAKAKKKTKKAIKKEAKKEAPLVEAVVEPIKEVAQEPSTPKVEIKEEVEPQSTTTFEEAMEKISKPIPKKRRSRKIKVRPKAGTIKKITEDKEIIAKSEEAATREAANEEKVKEILAETDESNDDDTKKVLTHPIKKKGTITYH